MHLHPDILLAQEIENAILDLEGKVDDRAGLDEIMILSDSTENMINDLWVVDPDGAMFYMGVFEDVLGGYMTESEHAVNDALRLVGLGR